MDAKKICFIMCANDQQYVNESAYYLSRLHIPDGMTTDFLVVDGASSMTQGYNEAMQASDAKYKVYLHQDVMIFEQDFIYKILDIFKNDKIGMIGMIGSTKLPENAVMWYGERAGKLYSSDIFMMASAVFGEVEGEYCEVEAIDGLLMATQYDISWREDLFKGWDFYDISQSFEFRKRGYSVVVPNQDTPWCLHDDGFMNLEHYYNERRKFIKEYR